MSFPEPPPVFDPFVGPIREDEYRCAHCNGVYVRGRSEEEAMARARERYGRDLTPEERAVLCDVCHDAFMAWAKATGLADAEGKMKDKDSLIEDEDDKRINVKKGRYFVAFWYVQHENKEKDQTKPVSQDYLAAMYRDEGSDEFNIVFRFCYHYPTGDERSWNRMVAKRSEKDLEKVGDSVVEALIQQGMTGPSTKVPLHTSNLATITKALLDAPFTKVGAGVVVEMDQPKTGQVN